MSTPQGYSLVITKASHQLTKVNVSHTGDPRRGGKKVRGKEFIPSKKRLTRGGGRQTGLSNKSGEKKFQESLPWGSTNYGEMEKK